MFSYIVAWNCSVHKSVNNWLELYRVQTHSQIVKSREQVEGCFSKYFCSDIGTEYYSLFELYATTVLKVHVKRIFKLTKSVVSHLNLNLKSNKFKTQLGYWFCNGFLILFLENITVMHNSVTYSHYTFTGSLSGELFLSIV